MHKYLIVIVGPTAVGKSALAVQVAKEFGCDIINADSRQVFEELSIGTAKPTSEETVGIPHHLLSYVSISEPYSAGIYERDALAKIEQLHRESDTIVLVGGSGLYIKALCDGLDELPSDENVRKDLETEIENSGITSLLEELKLKDVEYYNEVDKSNPRRVIRALEVCRLSDEKYSVLRKRNRKERPFRVIKIGLNLDRRELYEKINQRVDKMMESGLLEEAESVYPYKNQQALQTVGYKELFDFFEGKIDKERAIELIKQNSRRYAKRQMTWFKKDSEITWFEPNQFDTIISYIKSSIS